MARLSGRVLGLIQLDNLSFDLGQTTGLDRAKVALSSVQNPLNLKLCLPISVLDNVEFVV